MAQGVKTLLLMYDSDWQLQRVILSPTQGGAADKIIITEDLGIKSIIKSYVRYSRLNDSKVTIPLDRLGLPLLFIKVIEIKEEESLWPESHTIPKEAKEPLLLTTEEYEEVKRVVELNKYIRRGKYGKFRTYHITLLHPDEREEVFTAENMKEAAQITGLSERSLGYYDEQLKELRRLSTKDKQYPAGTKIKVDMESKEDPRLAFRKGLKKKKKNEYGVTLVRKDTGEVFKEYKCNTLKMVVYRTGVLRGRLQEYYNGYAELGKSKVKSIQKEIESHGLLLCINVRPV